MKHGDKIRKEILDRAVKMWPDFSHAEIARQMGLTLNAVRYHFPPETFKDAVAQHAVDLNNSAVIVQLIAMRHKSVKNMPERQKQLHIKSL